MYINLILNLRFLNQTMYFAQSNRCYLFFFLFALTLFALFIVLYYIILLLYLFIVLYYIYLYYMSRYPFAAAETYAVDVRSVQRSKLFI